MEKRTDAELILVGSELLNGEKQDHHLKYFGEVLKGVGLHLSECRMVGDDEELIAEIVRTRLTATHVLLVCGGLGPTEDDLTREAVAKGLNEPLGFSESAWEEIQSYFESRGRKVADTNKKQAYFPKGAVPIPNRNGTAPGFSLEKGGCFIAVLPGPPHELMPMVEDTVMPLLSRVLQRQPVFMETFRTTGIGESTLASIIEGVFAKFDMFVFSSLAFAGGVDIIVTERTPAQERDMLKKNAAVFEQELKRILGYKFYGKGTVSFEMVVGEALARRGMTLSIAESLTGGYIGKRITDIPGSSRYFLADVVAYSNEAKVRFLGVSENTLMRVGAVSEEVCLEMARGVREKTGATWGLSTTGIAGPEGGTEEKPVGLCYCGLSWNGGQKVRKRIFPGSRDHVRERIVYASLYMLYKHVMGE
ncbi:MAG: competence/damage-inducible protein A [Candidatus Latescibacteria bacterium]|nr:competence/damage-inducible protein A [Candidatus Latescibacterota bacterium]NIM21139.1 competence/damage-inducible protein A [Candidatus Latescibacterota bacterium]NIM65274.1 competence/damage-inducible protein A [Candidatus Latescibacterota bacterium]NIO01789.1 competence/damage-inducible protein A [Candidatus Latescibacterota bacterium]NIO28306.1 competence/damage-inducible protein A [Candidatus Latescibacterota bacterium]